MMIQRRKTENCIKKKKTYWKGSDLRVRLLSGMKSWYLSLHALLSDSPDGFLPMEWVRLWWPSTPSTSILSDDVDLRSTSSALFQLDRRDPDPPRRIEASLATVKCCCCSGLSRKDSSLDIFTSSPSTPQLRRSQQEALLLSDSVPKPRVQRSQRIKFTQYANATLGEA